MKSCTNCGASLNDNDLFCTQCGCPVAPAPEPAPEQYAGQAPEAQPEAAQESPFGSQYQEQTQQNWQQEAPGGQYQQYDSGSQGQQYGFDGQYQQQYYSQAQYYQNDQYQYQQQAPAPAVNEYDHTKEFDSDDISKNKCYCMLVYLFGVVGIIIALLASGAEKSDYINFHVRQAIKFSVINILSMIITCVLAFTIIIPIAGIIWMCVLLVLRIIAFVQVCMGQAKEPAIIRAFPFLK